MNKDGKDRIKPKRVPAGSATGGEFTEDLRGAFNIPGAISDSQPPSPVFKKEQEDGIFFTREEFKQIKASIARDTRKTILANLEEELRENEYNYVSYGEEEIPFSLAMDEDFVKMLIDGVELQEERRELQIATAVALLNYPAIFDHKRRIINREDESFFDAEGLISEANKIGVPIEEMDKASLTEFRNQVWLYGKNKDWREDYIGVIVKIDKENNIYYVYESGAQRGNKVVLIMYSVEPGRYGWTNDRPGGIVPPRIIDYDSPEQIIAYIDEVKALRAKKK